MYEIYVLFVHPYMVAALQDDDRYITILTRHIEKG